MASKRLLTPNSTGINAGHTGRHVDHTAIHAGHKALASSLGADDAEEVATLRKEA
jgi:hypothetical protein